MKKYLLILAGSLLLSQSLLAQTVRHSTHVSNQVIQGPCYIFAMVAALESSALEYNSSLSAGSMNFNEWQFYSTCANGGVRPWARAQMIPNTLSHARDYGATPGNHLNPSSVNCPNPNDAQAPCVADFDCAASDTWCRYNQMYTQGSGGGLGGACQDDNGTNYEFLLGVAHSYQYQVSGALFTEDTSPTAAEIGNALSNGKGVVAIFSNYKNSGREHAVFIFGKSGSQYSYKDSWPTSAGIYTSALLTNETLTRTYTLNGNMVGPDGTGNGGNPDPVACDYNISGASTLSGTHTYSLSGGTGTVSGITWSISSPATIISGQGTTSVTVQNVNCGSNTTRSLSVTYSNGGQSCSKSKNLSVPGTAMVQSIQLNGPASGQISNACPGSAVQLEAIDPVNPPGNTYYQWSISGATILNGQGNKQINIQIWNNPGQYQSWKVRAKKGNCAYTSYRTRTGYASTNCDGLGGDVGIYPRASIEAHQLDFSRVFLEEPNRKAIEVEVLSVTGQRMMQTTLSHSNPILKLEQMPSGLVFIRLTDAQEGQMEVFRHWVE